MLHGKENHACTHPGIKLKFLVHERAEKKHSCPYQIAPSPPQKSNGSPLGIDPFLGNLQVMLLKFKTKRRGSVICVKTNESRQPLVSQKVTAAR